MELQQIKIGKQYYVVHLGWFPETSPAISKIVVLRKESYDSGNHISIVGRYLSGTRKGKEFPLYKDALFETKNKAIDYTIEAFKNDIAINKKYIEQRTREIKVLEEERDYGKM